MSFKKQKKSLLKLIEKEIPKSLITLNDEEVTIVVIDGRYRTEFRRLRDHFQGKVAADINYVYGLLGTVRVTISHDEIVVTCLNEHDRHYSTHSLRQESVA